jgi:hypothetical protein
MKIRTHKELEVYQLAFNADMKIFDNIKTIFPKRRPFH